MKRFTWLKVLCSPFKRPKFVWYFGKIAIGVPYFYPRKWVKMNEEDCKKALADDLERAKKGGWNFAKERDWTYYKNHLKAVPLKIGFSYCDLGWKTKWEDTDYRHEWNPTLSFVFFGWQIAVRVIPEHDCHYWESWLYYELNTDKTKSKKERVEQCRKGFPNIWSTGFGDEKKTIDYYDLILKKKYL